MKQMPVLSLRAWSGGLCERAYGGLGERADRKARPRELALPQRVQEVALVLVRVGALEQAIALAVERQPRVVAGGDGIGAQRQGVVEEGLELDLLVAQHVGVRRAAGTVLGEEITEDAVPVRTREVHRVQRDLELRAHLARHTIVFLGGAVVRVVVALPVLHEQARDLVALFEQQQGGDGGVDAAGQADDDVGLTGHGRAQGSRSISCNSARGQRVPAR